jgi:hypothetical protein
MKKRRKNRLVWTEKKTKNFENIFQLMRAVHFIKHDIQGVFLKCAEILPTRL